MTRVAYFTSLNPQRSGISDYNEELLPYLAQYLDLDLFVAGFQPTNPAITTQFRIYDIAELPARRANYDVCVYHMGNNPHHIPIFKAFRQFPGVVMLHDGILHHFFWELVTAGEPEYYLEEFEYAYGALGRGLAQRFLTNGPQTYEYPMIYGVADRSWGVLVHNRFAQDRLQWAGLQVPIQRVPFPFQMKALGADSTQAATEWRAQWHIRPEQIVVASFGHIIPGKRLYQALRAFAEARRHGPNLLLCLVGEESPGVTVGAWMTELGLSADAVRVTGYVTFPEFQRAMAATDICLNLRYPTTGETSASLIRVLGLGIPTLVTDVGSFAELPDDACIKIAPDHTEHGHLVDALTRLAQSPELRHQIGSAAQTYVRDHCNIEETARAYARFISAAQPRAPTRHRPLLPLRSVLAPHAAAWPSPSALWAEPETRASITTAQSQAIQAAADLGLEQNADLLATVQRAWMNLGLLA